MLIYKYEFTIDSGRNREWFEPVATHIKYYKDNTKQHRLLFSKIVGVGDNNFVNHGISGKYVGYNITEITVD